MRWFYRWLRLLGKVCGVRPPDDLVIVDQRAAVSGKVPPADLPQGLPAGHLLVEYFDHILNPFVVSASLLLKVSYENGRNVRSMNKLIPLLRADAVSDDASVYLEGDDMIYFMY